MTKFIGRAFLTTVPIILLFYIIEIVSLAWTGATILNHSWIQVPMPWDFRVTVWFYGLITPEANIVFKLLLGFLWTCSIPFIALATILMGVIYIVFTPIVYYATLAIPYWVGSEIIKLEKKVKEKEDKNKEELQS